MIDIPPGREAEFALQLVQLQRQWQIAENCGLPETRAEQIWGMVSLEMRFICPDFMMGVSIAELARRWITSRNVHYVDAIIAQCADVGITPTATLWTLITEAARLRLAGETGPGTAAQVWKAGAKDHAMTMVATFHAAGFPIEMVASRVAMHLHLGGWRKFKASTLEKEYDGKWRKRCAAQKAYFDTVEGQERLKEVQANFETWPEANDEIKGERR